MARISHYDNPYAVAEWSRVPPPGTVCTPLVLATQDQAIAHGWLYARGGEDTVVLLGHPRANFSHHYLVPGLVERGYAVCGMTTRWLNNDSMLVHEVVLLDVAAVVAELRRRYDRVVLCGNSGGGSLFSFYQHQALAPDGARLTDTAAGDAFDLNRFEMPAADLIAYVAAHPGEGHYLLHAIDPAVTDEADPRSVDPALDMYDPANGFAPPPEPSRYTPEFLERYRAAQRARVERLDAVARQRVERRRAARADAARTGDTTALRAAIAVEFMTVYRTDADPRCVDPSLDPSARTYGSLWGTRPDLVNYGPFGFARVVTPEAWLSTWSGLSSRAAIAVCGERITTPALVVAYEGDHCIFPADQDAIVAALGTPPGAITRVDLPGDHYGFPAETGREGAAAALADWLHC